MITKQAPQQLINAIFYWCPQFASLTGAILAGGFLRAFYAGETPKDMDLYFESQEAFDLARTILTPENGWTLKADTEFALSYNDSRGKAIQLIRFCYGNPEEIIKIFDFTVCCACFKGELVQDDEDFVYGGKVYFHDDFFEHLAARILIFTGSRMPLSSLKRAFKFIARGYHICDENIIALTEGIIGTLNIESKESLADQIAGMDPEGGRRIRVID